jgi:hypothetical protein
LNNGTNTSQTIGFEQEICWPGITGIADQLIGADNTLNGVFANVADATGATLPSLPDGTVVYQQNGYNWNDYTWSQSSSSWSPDGSFALLPGVGALINNPTTTELVVTFVGTVEAGETGVFLPNNVLTFVSSVLPEAGGLQSGLGYQPSEGDDVLIWDNANGYWDTYTFQSESVGIGKKRSWLPPAWYNGMNVVEEPPIAVGQPLYIQPSTNNAWMEHY